ncbi:MAG: hypothetical protein KAR31_00250 [Candidatus Omnitrophica bacterium]|nr:hypothetical protein [Candidatus Omnitrophota bacterium]MCK5180395.1 hypothetical protein [Candidatus Omnitrophota bacterium]
MGEAMSIQHKELAAGRWDEMPFCEQMANVGSEVSRALNWRKKGKDDFSEKAVCRAFELLDLTIRPVRKYSRLKELLRVRECLADYFYGSNEFSSSESSWRSYFDHFSYRLRV